jgi:hypothetical protein
VGNRARSLTKLKAWALDIGKAKFSIAMLETNAIDFIQTWDDRKIEGFMGSPNQMQRFLKNALDR